LNEALKEGSTTATAGLRRNRLRSGLVVAEVALSLLLLISAGLMLRSFAHLVTLNRGFQTDHLLVAKLDFSISGYTTWVQPTTTRPQVTLLDLMQRLHTQPGVQSVAAVSSLSRSAEPPRQGISASGSCVRGRRDDVHEAASHIGLDMQNQMATVTQDSDHGAFGSGVEDRRTIGGQSRGAGGASRESGQPGRVPQAGAHDPGELGAGMREARHQAVS